MQSARYVKIKMIIQNSFHLSMNSKQLLMKVFINEQLHIPLFSTAGSVQ